VKVSVLIPYFQGRRPLLERTLWLLRRQTYDDYEVLLLDDGSDEKIENLAGGQVIYEKLRLGGAPPRASNMAYVRGYRKCQGEFVILTHPEYMPPLNAIERMVATYDGTARLSATALALPRELTDSLDDYPWRTNVDVFQTVPGFWGFLSPWGWTNQSAGSWCHHFAFTGQTRIGWDQTDFIPETEERHMNDSWIHRVEVEMGRPPLPAGFAVYHQHHRRTTEWPFPKQSVRVARIAG
jgi:hypothetical protein